MVCVSALLIMTSCSDWLDVSPSTETDRETLFSTEKGFSEAIKGVYTHMGEPALYGRNLSWGLLDYLAGQYQMTFTEPFNAARQYAYVEGDTYVNDALVSELQNYWTTLYNIIAEVNSILDKIDVQESVFSGDNYSVLKGEAIGLRAFLHFEILRLYGDIYERSKDKPVMPYVNRLTALVSPELTGEMIINEVIAELQLALELLENDPMRLQVTPSPILASTSEVSLPNFIADWHNRRFHFNYFAAKATLARAYLWKGDRDNAFKMATEVIADQATHFQWVRATNLTAIASETSSNQDRTFATEHIFALNMTHMEELIMGYQNTMASTGATTLLCNASHFAPQEQGLDPRYRYLLASIGSTLVPAKYYQKERVFDYFKARFPMIRISEMYYIAAECAPDWQEGLTYLENVRINRSIGAISSGVNSYETLQDAICLEYRKEFIAEGQLWHYYKRRQFSPPINAATGEYGWRGVYLYLFPRPQDEELYGNRVDTNNDK